MTATLVCKTRCDAGNTAEIRLPTNGKTRIKTKYIEPDNRYFGVTINNTINKLIFNIPK